MIAREPRWLTREVVEDIHARLIREHGGSYGIRDPGLLDSALMRARNHWGYGDPPGDLPALAAAYAYGISRNHPFIDGNKRVAFMAAYVFLKANGLELIADPDEAYAVMIDLATGELSEGDFARWLGASTRPIE
jgi:death on curing protein